MPSNAQLELDFSPREDGEDPRQLGPVLPGLFPDGLDRWRNQRREQLEDLARELGLPLGHTVELTLLSGPVLQGKLTLAHETLWIEPSLKKRSRSQLLLAIGAAEFFSNEIASCIRQD